MEEAATVRRTWLFILLFAGILLLSACGRREPEPEPTTTPTPTQDAPVSEDDAEASAVATDDGEENGDTDTQAPDRATTPQRPSAGQSAPAPDISRPQVVAFQIDPPNLPYNESTARSTGDYCCIVFTARLVDDITGIAEGEFWFYVPERPEKKQAIHFSESNRQHGTALDGTYVEKLSGNPPFSDPGPWELFSIRLEDRAGNVAYWSGDTLAQLEVANTYRLGWNDMYLPSVVNSNAPSPAAARTDANLRDGPGLNYDVTGGVRAGDQLSIVAQSQDWYQLDDGQWIAAFLVENAPANVPTVQP